jgi:hypothetical protein
MISWELVSVICSLAVPVRAQRTKNHVGWPTGETLFEMMYVAMILSVSLNHPVRNGILKHSLFEHPVWRWVQSHFHEHWHKNMFGHYISVMIV